MFDQYFGQYLLNNGILTAKQLRDALEQEQFTKAKLGVLAINTGFMTAEQVEEVHHLQRTIDKRFGEIAVAKGYLAQDKVEYLLAEQKNNALSLSQVIIDKGYLNFSQLETALSDFKKKNQITSEFDMSQALQLLETGVSDMYLDYAALFLRSITRFLDDIPLVDIKLIRSLKMHDVDSVKGWMVSQDITGSSDLFTGIVLEDAAFLELARRFSEEELQTIDSLAQDSVSEFLNVHNGIFLLNMSNRGINLDLEVPKITSKVSCKPGEGWYIPIELSFGTIGLIVNKKKI